MNNKLVLALLTIVTMHAHAQIEPLTALAAQEYITNIPRILQDLKEGKLNPDIQDVIKKQLIYKHLNCFPLSSLTISLPFGISKASISPSGQDILILPDDNYHSTLVLLNLSDRKTKPIIRYNNSIKDTTFSPDGKYILTTKSFANIQILNAVDPQAAPITIPDSNVESACFSPDGKFILGRDRYSDEIYLWNMADLQSPPIVLDHTDILSKPTLGNPLDEDGELEEYPWITTAACSPDGKHILTGTSLGRLYLWDSTNPQQPPKILGDDGHFMELAVSLLGHGSKMGSDITSITFSPGGRYALTGSDDHTARLWDIAHPEAAPRILNHDSPVYAVAISPNGQYALTVSNKKAYIWNLLDCSVPPLVLQHNYTDAIAAFSPDGRYAVTTVKSSDGKSVLHFWDLTTWNNHTLEDIIKRILPSSTPAIKRRKI